MPFQVELAHLDTGETKDLLVTGKDIDSAINLICEEYPDYVLQFIGVEA